MNLTKGGTQAVEFVWATSSCRPWPPVYWLPLRSPVSVKVQPLFPPGARSAGVVDLFRVAACLQSFSNQRSLEQPGSQLDF